MTNYCIFKDTLGKRREEIILYQQLDSNPVIISFATPSGIYKYHEEVRDDIYYPSYSPYIPRSSVFVPRNCFYKYVGPTETTEVTYSYSPMLERDINARWERVNDIESINFVFPNNKGW